MKILLCHNHYQQRGGEDQVFDDETWLLESHGHEVLRYTRHNDQVSEMGRLELARKTIWNREVHQELCDLIARVRPGVVHCTNTFPLLSPAVYDAAHARGVPVVQSLHNYRLLCPNALFLRDGRVCESCLGKTIPWPGVVHGCYRDSRAATGVLAAMLSLHRLRRTWTRKVDRYIALAEFARQKLIDGGLPGERIVVKPNFVPSAPAAGEGGGGFALFVGRLSPEKGVAVLLEAWKQVRSAMPLKIVGDGPMAGQVQQAAASDARIEWLGRQPSEDVMRQMRDATLLVIPTICYEVCPKTLIESFAAGTPVLASRLGSMIEMVDHDRTGWHFEPGNAASLAACIDRVWPSRQELQGIRRKARREFEARYTADANYAALMQIYRDAITHKAASATARRKELPLLEEPVAQGTTL
jgi:glycosyltransferase involved in cell wall biosynthesis